MSGLQYEILLIYVDDCLVFSNTFEQHIDNLETVLSRLHEVNLKVAPKKCHFFHLKLHFIGHIIEKEGISVNDEKIKIIKDWQVPQNAKQVKSFLGLNSYYRRLIKDFAKIATPLNQLTLKNQTFKWTHECQHAFDTLKEA